MSATPPAQPPAPGLRDPEEAAPAGLLTDAAWGLLLAALVLLILLFMGSEDRGFIYVDF